MNFAKILRTYRSMFNITQDELAALLGVNRSIYTCYEIGTVSPTIEAIHKVAQVFFLSIEHFDEEEVKKAELEAEEKAKSEAEAESEPKQEAQQEAQQEVQQEAQQEIQQVAQQEPKSELQLEPRPGLRSHQNQRPPEPYKRQPLPMLFPPPSLVLYDVVQKSSGRQPTNEGTVKAKANEKEGGIATKMESKKEKDGKTKKVDKITNNFLCLQPKEQEIIIRYRMIIECDDPVAKAYVSQRLIEILREIDPNSF